MPAGGRKAGGGEGGVVVGGHGVAEHPAGVQVLHRGQIQLVLTGGDLATRLWSRGFTEAFSGFATWAAAGNATLHHGGTAAAVTKAWQRTTEQLDDHPVTVGTTQLNGTAFRSITRAALKNPAYYPLIIKAWDVASGPTGTSTPLPTVIPDNLLSAQFAIMCQDTSWPRHDAKTIARLIDADKKTHPLAGGLGAGVWPCSYWHQYAKPAGITPNPHGPRDILILQNRNDPASPYAGAVETRHAFRNRAGMITINAGGHGVDTTAPCISGKITDFLTRDTLPRDQTC
ncbi:alpha/beta hydrolase [Microbispora hainanensis]|uniref:alpha/beta hydrolase n=1 Tax=Microbispora hainanensis TaxID=568844 RepID=UPI0034095B13